jgi:hypothetical protein
MMVCRANESGCNTRESDGLVYGLRRLTLRHIPHADQGYHVHLRSRTTPALFRDGPKALPAWRTSCSHAVKLLSRNLRNARQGRDVVGLAKHDWVSNVTRNVPRCCEDGAECRLKFCVPTVAPRRIRPLPDHPLFVFVLPVVDVDLRFM